MRPKDDVRRVTATALGISLGFNDADADRIVSEVIERARTGTIGDAKVWILPVESAHRIRTGEAGTDAV